MRAVVAVGPAHLGCPVCFVDYDVRDQRLSRTHAAHVAAAQGAMVARLLSDRDLWARRALAARRHIERSGRHPWWRRRWSR